jgi:hypothetical protein
MIDMSFPLDPKTPLILISNDLLDSLDSISINAQSHGSHGIIGGPRNKTNVEQFLLESLQLQPRF